MTRVTKTDMILECLRQNPEMSNQELAEAVDMDVRCIRSTLTKLRQKNFIVQTGQGEKRHISVMVESTAGAVPADYKKEMLKSMCDCYYEDFLAAELYTERVEIGKMICRILEKI